MNPTLKKALMVLATLVAMAAKQYSVHGTIDLAELAGWVTANWDVLIAGGVFGWQFIRRPGDTTAAAKGG